MEQRFADAISLLDCEQARISMCLFCIDVFAESNRHFDIGRFIRACDLEPTDSVFVAHIRGLSARLPESKPTV